MFYSELRYQAEKTKTYLGSPSLVRMDDGTLIASHDYFGPSSPKTREQGEMLSSIYRSEDDGATWNCITHITYAFWSSLFIHRKALYLLGTDRNYGSIVIRRSNDGGFTWTSPLDARSGRLFEGGPENEAPNYHCAPVPVIVHEGRIYRAFEDNLTAKWPSGFQACVISAPEDSDLLEAANWTISNKIIPNPQDFPDGWGGGLGFGWLEGNMVAAPDGKLYNILRIYSDPEPDKAVIMELTEEGKKLSFDPKRALIDLPGGAHKFTIRYDAESKLYLTLSNNNTSRDFFSQRNILSLCASADLLHWQVIAPLLTDESGLNPADSLRLTGFQYADWQIDGEDLIYLVRTAWRGAIGFHDSNRITFHKLKNFRKLLSGKGDKNNAI